MWSWKKLIIPKSNETKEVDAVQLWIVEWVSRYGAYSGDLNREFEAFPSKEKADEFADALRKAFKLIRHTSNTGVKVYPSANNKE